MAFWQRAAITAALLTATACNSTTTGQPKPIPGEPPPTTTTSKAPDYSLAHLCELLAPEEAQALGGSAEGEEGNALNDGHGTCKWADATSLMVGFQEGVTATDPDIGPGITNTPTTIDGLTAMQSLQTDSAVICEVMVDLPSRRMFTSSAAVLTAGEGRFDACEVASQLANLVIPRVRDQ